jgi:hypothetical protein
MEHGSWMHWVQVGIRLVGGKCLSPGQDIWIECVQIDLSFAKPNHEWALGQRVTDDLITCSNIQLIAATL